jgi:hypothetical protein
MDARAGRPSKAIDDLYHAQELGFYGFAESDTRLKSLHSDPRFRALAAALAKAHQNPVQSH